jgi:hypothetical protein
VPKLKAPRNETRDRPATSSPRGANRPHDRRVDQDRDGDGDAHLLISSMLKVAKTEKTATSTIAALVTVLAVLRFLDQPA